MSVTLIGKTPQEIVIEMAKGKLLLEGLLQNLCFTHGMYKQALGWTPERVRIGTAGLPPHLLLFLKVEPQKTLRLKVTTPQGETFEAQIADHAEPFLEWSGGTVTQPDIPTPPAVLSEQPS